MGAHALVAQIPQDLAVPIHISAGLNPPAVLLTWENQSPSDIILRRRIKGQAGNTWVELINAPETLLDGHFDLGLSGGETYEYALERKTGSITANGYAYANFFTPVVDKRGKILVFIDSITADQLGADLITFKNDLRGEGWQTVSIKTGNSTTVQWVKNQIVNAFNADPNNVKAVLLIGNTPIPYSGSNAWDGQPDHQGAWPCDAYYGDVNGTWTDNSINISNTSRLANRNVPGDGKFDQNQLPSAMELMVGRLDFRRLSAATFGMPPVELLRRYLIKNHLFRTGQYMVPRRALVDDHLGWSNGDAFAADGYRNAYPLTDTDQVLAGDFLGQSSGQNFLLGYGAGTAGTYSSAGGIGSSADVAAASVNVVFTSLFGDYFGDWDFETNPLMPSLLAAQGGVLTCIWSGRPHTLQHGLATGETIGFCLKETQNAQYNDAYGHFASESGAHVALLGDPTLRAQIVSPISNFTAVSNCNKVNLHWTAAPDSGTLGYIVYRAFSQDGPYERVTPDFITQNAWEDLAPVSDTLFYAVRAMKLEQTPGGGAFYNSSTSPIKSVVFVPGTGPTAIGLGGTLTCSNPTLTLGTNFQPFNSTWQWYNPGGQPFSGSTATESGVYTVVVTAPNGCTVAAYATVDVDSLLPVFDYPDVVTLDCSNQALSVIIPAAMPGVQFTYNGQNVNPGDTITFNSTAVFTVFSPDNGCSDTHTVLVNQDNVAPTVLIEDKGLVLDCNHASVQLSAVAMGTDLKYSWQGNGIMSDQPIIAVTAPGVYCCVVTGSNTCTSSSCATVAAMGNVISLEIVLPGDPCAVGDKILFANAGGGTAPYAYAWSNGGTGESTTILAGFSGSVTVTVTDNNNCSAVASFLVAAAPDVLALVTKESAPGAADGYIDLLVSGGQMPYSFLWSNGSTTEDIGSLSNGIYVVTVTGGNGCIKVLSIPLTTVGVEDLFTGYNVSTRPNPVQNRLTVHVENPDNIRISLSLRDINGRIFAAQEDSGETFIFDTTALSNGIYVLWVATKSGTKGFKLLVAK